MIAVGGLGTRLKAQELSFASTSSSAQFDTVGAQYSASLQEIELTAAADVTVEATMKESIC